MNTYNIGDIMQDEMIQTTVRLPRSTVKLIDEYIMWYNQRGISIGRKFNPLTRSIYLRGAIQSTLYTDLEDYANEMDNLTVDGLVELLLENDFAGDSDYIVED